MSDCDYDCDCAFPIKTFSINRQLRADGRRSRLLLTLPFVLFLQTTVIKSFRPWQMEQEALRHSSYSNWLQGSSLADAHSMGMQLIHRRSCYSYDYSLQGFAYGTVMV